MPKPNKPLKKPALVLASASPRRRMLMREHRYRFVIDPSHIPEKASPRLSGAQFVKTLALQKAKAVARRRPTDVILGADTVVYFRGRIIGKPKGTKDAERILTALSANWQRVYTGVAVVYGKKAWVSYAVSYVKFRKLTDLDIRRAARLHQDKAGAYSVQEKNDPFVSAVSGDFDNVVGLPMRVVKKLLSRCAHHLLKAVGHNVDFQI